MPRRLHMQKPTTKSNYEEYFPIFVPSSSGNGQDILYWDIFARAVWFSRWLFLFAKIFNVRRVVFLPIELIKAADNEYWLRSLAYYIRLKSLYKNNTHYGFTLRSLAEKVGCSPACLSFHLKILESKGLIRKHGGNVTFLGMNKLRSLFKYNVIGVPVNRKHQHDILRGQLIRFNLSAQQHKIKKSGTQMRTKGFIPFTQTEKTNSSYVGLSAAGVGNVLGLSQKSGSRIREKLNVLGQIRGKRVYSILMKNIGLRDFTIMRREGDIPPYSFYRDNKVIVERRMKMEYVGGSQVTVRN